MSHLKPPFPWFGGKAKAAPAIWKAFGDVPNYVEPFFGGGAALLLRPDYDPQRHTETVNDLDSNLANFWRCLQKDPDQLASWTDWPVNEVDLHARHQWLVNRTWGADSDFRERMMSDHEFCDFQQAGWWVWGLCQWIGSGFCDKSQATAPLSVEDADLGDNGRGVHRQLPHLGNNGRGVHRKQGHVSDAPSISTQEGCSSSAAPFGGQREGMPEASANLYAYFRLLRDRFRRVRVCCGDFERILGPSPTVKLGLTGVLLDPPYDRTIREANLYACESDAAGRARDWAIKNGGNSKLRIALCGYSEEHQMPEGWWAYTWKAAGGYGSQGQGRGRENCEKETIWFSPHCINFVEAKPTQITIFDALGGAA